MSPVPLNVVESERAHGPLLGSETAWLQGPAGVEGGTGGVLGTGWKTAHTAYQPLVAPRVAVPCWAPAALDVMSSSNPEPLEVCARGVYGTPALLPGATEPGAPPASKAANTSSPAPTAAVAPVSTVVPSPRAERIWPSEPATARPAQCAPVACRHAASGAE